MISFCLRHACELNDTTVMIFSFFWLKTALAIMALSFVTCTFSPVSLNLHPPRPEMVHVSSFLEPVGHSLRISADLNRRHKPVAEPFLLCLTLFPSFVKTKAFSEEQEARRLIKFKAKFFSHLLWSSGHRRLKFFPLNF